MISKIFKITIITTTFHTSHLFIWLFNIFPINIRLMRALSSALHAFAKFTEAIPSHLFELILSRYGFAYIILIFLSRRLSNSFWWANIAGKGFKIEIWIRGCTLRCCKLGSSSLLLLLILLPIIIISFTVLSKGMYTSRSIMEIIVKLRKF